MIFNFILDLGEAKINLLVLKYDKKKINWIIKLFSKKINMYVNYKFIFNFYKNFYKL